MLTEHEDRFRRVARQRAPLTQHGQREQARGRAHERDALRELACGCEPGPYRERVAQHAGGDATHRSRNCGVGCSVDGWMVGDGGGAELRLVRWMGGATLKPLPPNGNSDAAAEAEASRPKV